MQNSCDLSCVAWQSGSTGDGAVRGHFSAGDLLDRRPNASLVRCARPSLSRAAQRNLPLATHFLCRSAFAERLDRFFFAVVNLENCKQFRYLQ